MRWPLLPLLCLSPLLANASVLDQRHHYDVRVDERFQALKVTACFDGRAPDFLLAGANDADRLLREAYLIADGERRPLSSERNRLYIPVQPDDGCIHYAVDLGLAARSRSLGIAARTGDALVISPRVWLWRPRTLNRYIDVYLRFHLPEDFALSVPWPVVDTGEDGEPVYRLDHPPLGWDASIAFGHFRPLDLTAGELEVRAALMTGPGSGMSEERAARWLQQGLDAASQIYGGFPGPRAQVIVVPLDSGDRPLAQGRVSRAGGPGLLLGLSTRQPARAYEADGLIAHEFMHLLHPPVTRNHRWLSEGIATYYQYIGLARAGHLSECEAWRRLLADMEDGYWDRRPGTLRDITLHMGSRGGADYVYWSGAALMLMSDVALRQRDGNISLDHILARWTAERFDNRRAFDGRDTLQQLDEYAGGEPLFAPLYDDYILSTGFPDINELLDALGLSRLGDDFALDDDAPLAHIRRAIMAPRQENLLTPAEADDNKDEES